jgi:predicted dehydrogenase
MEPVNWGILSTANIGLGRVLPGMKKGRLSRLAAICSRDLAKAEAAAAKLGIPKAYGSYEALLADPEIEVVYNPLPNNMHVDWTIRAAEAGKHVLCEKPIAMNAAEAERLLPVRERTGMRIQEAFMVRYHPQWLRARELVRAGKVGRLRAIQTFFSYDNRDPNNVRNRSETGGGGIYDIGCYPVVISRFLFEAEPTRVVCLLERDPDFGTDRLATAILDFAEGQASFTCSTQVLRYQRVQIVGTEGRVEVVIPFNAPQEGTVRIMTDGVGDLGDATARPETFADVDQYMLQGEAFSEIVRSGRKEDYPLEDAIANMRVIDALFRSAESECWERV